MAWVEIVVEAEDQDEAYDIANDKYNDGDYVEDVSNFENMEATDVTKYYEENKIPF